LKIIVESKQESVSRTCEESEIKRGGNVWCSWRGTATLEEGGEEDAVLVLKPLMFVVVSSFLVCGDFFSREPKEKETKKARRARRDRKGARVTF
jgi:hypothetical protein